MSAADDGVRLIKELGKASSVLGKEGQFEVSICCEAVKKALALSLTDLLSDIALSPAVTSKSFDGTPIRTIHRSTHTLVTGKKFKVVGYGGGEFLIATQFFRIRQADGTMATRVRLEEPTKMTSGKTAEASLAIGFGKWSTLRSLGLQGLVVEHYAFDRAGYTKLDRLIRQLHQLRQANWVDTLPMSVHKAEQSEWVITTPCALHDGHNSFKWALKSYFDNKELVRDCYVAVASLRNSMDIIVSEIGGWVAKKVSLVPGRSIEWQTQQAQLWHTLGVDTEIVEILVDRLQLHYDPVADRLEVCQEAAAAEKDVVSVVVTTLLDSWRFVPWTDSRWITLGQSSRTLVYALLTGVGGLVRYLQADPSISKFYLNGFGRLAQSRRHFLVLCSVVSRVPESAMVQLMEDGRVAQTYEDLWMGCAEEMRWMIDLKPHVWAALAGLCGARPEDLASEVVDGGHASWHFFWRRVLSVAADLPWRLCRGDVEANLAALKAGDMPVEPVSKKIYKLLHMDFPLSQIVEAVGLVGEVSWTTLVAEQQHGTLAAVKKNHPDYDPSTLVSRTLMVQANRLLPGQSAEERQLKKIVSKLDKLSRKNPDKMSGQAWYLRKLKELKDRKIEEGTIARPDNASIAMRWMVKSHATLYARHSLATKMGMETLAKLEANKKWEAIREEMEDLRAARDKLLREIDGVQDEVPPMVLSSTPYDEKTLDHIGRLMGDERFRTTKNIDKLRADALECPVPWPDSFVKELAAFPVWQQADPAMPAWAKELVFHRDFLKDVILVVPNDDSALVQWWKPLYMVQTAPFYIGTVKVRGEELLLDPPERVVGPMENFDWVKYRFQCNFAMMSSAADMPVTTLDELHVVEDVHWVGGVTYQSKTRMRPLRALLNELPEPEARRAAAPRKDNRGRTKAERDHHEELVRNFPWLQHLDMDYGYTADEPADSDAARERAAGILGTIAVVDLPEEEAMAMAYAALEKARAALGDAEGSNTDDFGTRVLSWNDATAGYCKNALAKDFCKARGEQQGMRFNFGAHGDRACGIMARYWAHKMQYYFNLDLVSGGAVGGLVYTAEHHDAYDPPREARELADEAELKADTRKRMVQLERMFRK